MNDLDMLAIVETTSDTQAADELHKIYQQLFRPIQDETAPPEAERAEAETAA